MSEGTITPVIEEYLRAILDLGIAGRPVIGRRLADSLGVAPSTVTATLQRMGKDGLDLVTLNERKEIILSKRGAAYAIAAARRHHLSERLLVDYLGFDWARAHGEAERWQHALTEETEKQLWESLGRPTRCPHGNPIPGTGARPSPHAFPLSEVHQGQHVVVERIVEEAEDDLELMNFYERSGLIPRTPLDVVEVSAAAGLITVEQNGHRVPLGLSAASKIRVVDAEHADSLPAQPRIMSAERPSGVRPNLAGLLAE
jgi:DtxR family transcriptional regulator, Mn-dependent transcriptional regulator